MLWASDAAFSLDCCVQLRLCGLTTRHNLASRRIQPVSDHSTVSHCLLMACALCNLPGQRRRKLRHVIIVLNPLVVMNVARDCPLRYLPSRLQTSSMLCQTPQDLSRGVFAIASARQQCTVRSQLRFGRVAVWLGQEAHHLCRHDASHHAS